MSRSMMWTRSSPSRAWKMAWFAVKCENFTSGETEFACAKYAPTRSGEVPNGDESSAISGRRSLAKSRLSMATHSAHWRRRPRSLRPMDSAIEGLLVLAGEVGSLEGWLVGWGIGVGVCVGGALSFHGVRVRSAWGSRDQALKHDRCGARENRKLWRKLLGEK
ncbi:hypothetical protein CR513_20291, partial [Mucuna pruriens]